jgi:ATP-dependent DNA helicase PIF1
VADSSMSLNEKQNYAYELMKSGKNVFLTGVGGTGKSHVITTFINDFKASKNIGMTSTTGISALIFGGTTLHSFTGVGLGTDNVQVLIKKIMSMPFLRNRWQTLDTLIIDEISMLSIELFDKLNEIAHVVRQSKLPFGGIQLIASGDFLQLPTVKSSGFCFESKSWDNIFPTESIVYLDEIIRQSDTKFQNILNKIRIGCIDEEVTDLLDARIGVELKNNYGIEPTKLYCLNRDVDALNNKKLIELLKVQLPQPICDENDEINLIESTPIENKMFRFDMDITKKTIRTGKIIKLNDIQIASIKKNVTAPDVLRLCVGAQVMLLCNKDLDNGMANGSRGIVTEFVGSRPKVRFLNGNEAVIGFYEWKIKVDNTEMISVVQIPLRLAYAFTIHKCQGMTLDFADLDLSNVFDVGQSYVALSRVKNLDGLSISQINYEKIRADPTAIEFYRKLDKSLKES